MTSANEARGQHAIHDSFQAAKTSQLLYRLSALSCARHREHNRVDRLWIVWLGVEALPTASGHEGLPDVAHAPLRRTPNYQSYTG